MPETSRNPTSAAGSCRCAVPRVALPSLGITTNSKSARSRDRPRISSVMFFEKASPDLLFSMQIVSGYTTGFTRARVSLSLVILPAEIQIMRREMEMLPHHPRTIHSSPTHSPRARTQRGCSRIG